MAGQWRLLAIIKDILFPIECLSCGREGKWVCRECFDQIPINQKQCVEPDLILDQIWIAAPYENKVVEKAIKALKYDFVEELAEELANLIIKYIKQNNLNTNNCLVTVVPLNKKRLLQRAFNQSELIGEKVAQYFQLKFIPNLLVRIVNTKAQAKLDKQERQENVKNAFIVNQEITDDKEIIIIDDVFTTGSTLNECAKILKKVGAKRVIGCVVARN